MFTDEILTANLDALERAQSFRPSFGRLAADTRAVADHVNGLRVELRTAGGDWIPLDGDDPRGFAQARVSELSAAGDLLVVGPGLGYLLDEMERTPSTARVLAIEPDPALAVLFLSRRDWSSWFDSGRLRLLTGPDYIGAAGCGRVLRDTPAPAIVTNPAQAAHRSSTVDSARVVAERIASEATANANARRQFAGRYLLQTIQNLPVVAAEGDASALDGAFAGHPAVLVAAGPSLDDSLPVLRRLQHHAVIIAADTTLRPLLAGGVRPHIVAGVDPAEINAKHLSGLSDTDGIWLVSEGSLHPAAFSGFQGRTFTFKVSNHEPWRWLKTIGVERGTLRAWGSVATSAFDLALRMGCDPIVFVGHDFAYTGNRSYCDNTVFHEEWYAWLRDKEVGDLQHYHDKMISARPAVMMTDVNGAEVRTADHLVAFRNWIAEQTTVTADRRFVNATGAGLLMGPRIEQLPLEQVLSEHAPAFMARPILAARHRQSTRPSSHIPDQLRAMLSAWDGPAAEALVASWIDFTAGTVDADTLRDALKTRLSTW